MAKGHKEVSEASREFPVPPRNLRVNTTLWLAGTQIYRIHSKQFTAAQFNPGAGNARFSPLRNGVSTLYGGVSTGVALMETLFHDLPVHTDGVSFDLRRAENAVHSVLAPVSDLMLADLNPRTLRKIGVTRAELLDSSASQYPLTREYALAIYEAHPELHGLQWSSRQHGGFAIMLFGDRVKHDLLQVLVESELLLESEMLMDILEEEADQLGLILLEPGGGRK
ncbi:RES family NAD+ phosphorylase [Dryocola sp. LX212]